MNSECSICYELTRFTLLCNHSFCLNCIFKWCTINPTCPMCRHEISDEIQDSYLMYKIKTHDNNKAKELLKSFFNSIIFKFKYYKIISYFKIYLNIKILTELKLKVLYKKISWDGNVYMYKNTFLQSFLQNRIF